MNAPVLPGPLADNPRLDRWVTFPAPGKVTVGTGRVELGQGVLTAMAQIAADELGVAMETHHHPLRRHRIHAERGLHRRQPIDPVRRRGHAAGLRRCAWPLHRTGGKSARLRGERTRHSRRRHPSQRRSDRSGLLDARRRCRSHRQGDRQRQAQGGRGFRQHRPKQRAARFAGQDFRRTRLHPRHGARRHGACARGAPAQSRRRNRSDRRTGDQARRQGAGRIGA